jgi:putative oxidoreductase
MTFIDRFASVYARLALGSAFLSAVAARFGLWRDRGPHPFARFFQYTGEVTSFLPAPLAPFLAVGATAAETTLGILLITGFTLRWTSIASAILPALFGASMPISGASNPLSMRQCFRPHRLRFCSRSSHAAFTRPKREGTNEPEGSQRC